jgi:hypothetical protein
MIAGALGIAGGIASGIMGMNDAKKAAKAQQEAMKKAYDNLTINMDPQVVNKLAQRGDEERAKSRLALQAQIDPELAKQRGIAEAKITESLLGIGKADSDTVAARTAQEALREVPGAQEAKDRLVDAALQELKAGATLPPDVQAEFVKAGLEQAGGMTGAANARGAGGVILRQVLGTAGLNLKKQRQDQAASLLTAAGNLDAQRQQILQGLFPRLQQQQMGNLTAASGVLTLGDQMLPESGLSGSDMANIWLARIGAQNELTTGMGKAKAEGIMAQGAARNKLIGSVTGGLGGMMGGGGAGGILSGIGGFFNSGGGGGTGIMSTATSGGGSYKGWAVPSIG